MSTSKSHNPAPYFNWLKQSASPQVKRELEKMERSKRSSFSSVRTILNDTYGRRVTKSTRT